MSVNNEEQVNILMSYMYLLDNISNPEESNLKDLLLEVIGEKCKIRGFKDLLYMLTNKIWPKDKTIKYIKYIWDRKNDKFIKAINNNNNLICDYLYLFAMLALNVQNMELYNIMIRHNIENRLIVDENFLPDKELIKQECQIYLNNLLDKNHCDGTLFTDFCHNYIEYDTRYENIKKIYENMYAYNIDDITYILLNTCVYYFETYFDDDILSSDKIPHTWYDKDFDSICFGVDTDQCYNTDQSDDNYSDISDGIYNSQSSDNYDDSETCDNYDDSETSDCDV
jgi:hypothetical protein